MKTCSILLGLLCALSLVPAQKVDTVIPVPDAPWSITHNPAANHIYCICGEGECIAVIDGKTNAVLKTMACSGEPWALEFNPKNSKLYCINRSLDFVSIWNANLETLSTGVNAGKAPEALCYNPKENVIYTANQDGPVNP